MTNIARRITLGVVSRLIIAPSVGVPADVQWVPPADTHRLMGIDGARLIGADGAYLTYA